jgi:folate-binding protein YgfZ
VIADAAERAVAVRRSAGLFALPERGLLQVEGADRVRWLDGMLSNHVAALAPDPDHSGCHALLLTPTARILADPHVLHRGEAFWLELCGDAAESTRVHLERYVIADDVTLQDVSNLWARFSLEGPKAAGLLERVTGTPLRLAPNACADLRIGSVAAVVAAYGFSGAPGFQLFVPSALAADVAGSLHAEGGASLVEGDAATLEILRIESGIPRLGAELDEDVLPAEAGLIASAVSLTKGCYTGQEIVARLESRGQVAHRLVGLRCAGETPPAPDTALEDESGKRVGEVTSACLSAVAGPIALGYVRRPFDTPGSALRVGSQQAWVTELPFVAAVLEEAG